MSDKSKGAAAMFFWALSALFFILSLVCAWQHSGLQMLYCIVLATGALALGSNIWSGNDNRS